MPTVGEHVAHLQRVTAAKAARAGYTRAKAAKFRASQQWRRARYRCLAENARRHLDGNARCELCSRTAEESGRSLHVDHRAPVSKCWERRLDPANLRVMCGDCNEGRSNRPLEGEEP